MTNPKSIVQKNEDSHIKLYEIEDIKQKIYTIRGKQVMLDSDIATLYDVETKKLNQAVKRNIKRFPENYCFQLNKVELRNLRSQTVTSSMKENNYGGRRYLPYVFTEQGVAMLSAVLHSDRAINVSIRIIDAFIEMRRFILNNQMLFERISNLELKQIEYQKSTDDKFEKVFKYIEKHKEVEQKNFL